LDWLLAAAAARRLRLLPCLTNYWADYGGMRCYVRWAHKQRGQQASRQKPYCTVDLEHRRPAHAAMLPAAFAASFKRRRCRPFLL
jgi:hypothetical protein